MTKATNNPVPVRLGEIKKDLQKEAHQLDRSMNYLIVKIIKDYFQKKKASV